MTEQQREALRMITNAHGNLYRALAEVAFRATAARDQLTRQQRIDNHPSVLSHAPRDVETYAALLDQALHVAKVLGCSDADVLAAYRTEVGA